MGRAGYYLFVLGTPGGGVPVAIRPLGRCGQLKLKLDIVPSRPLADSLVLDRSGPSAETRCYRPEPLPFNPSIYPRA